MKELLPKKIDPLTLSEKALTKIFEAYSDYQKVREQEETKREGIQAWREINLAEINKDRETLKLYLEETFKERRQNIDKLMEILDKGLETENVELVMKSLEGIVGIVKQSAISEIDKLINDKNVKKIEF